jgi:methylphosphonate synthase
MPDLDREYLRRIGARIYGEANDLKRTPQALADDLGQPIDLIEHVIAGEANVETAEGLLRAIADLYPVSLADLWVERDDTDAGVVVMRAEASAKTARVFDRVDKDGNLSAYYEYRDTAMSSRGPYKPEWIKELRSVKDTDPNNPDVAYNNGHLMYQLTFFIGEVNFYWEIDGKKFVSEMNTGDSNFIMPYCPHSFASRNPDAPSLIIAVTFVGAVRRALESFQQLGAEHASTLAGNSYDPLSRQAAVIARNRDAESLGIADLAARLAKNGIEKDRALTLSAGEALPTQEEIDALATALNVRPRDLIVTPLDPSEAVVVAKIASTGSRAFPDTNSPQYRFTDLARTRHQPELKGFEVAVLGDDREKGWVRHGLHEYVYNYGDAPVVFWWGENRSEILGPGDSAYVQPMVPHGFTRADGGAPGNIVMIRVPGEISAPVLDEFSGFGADRTRVTGETKTWF